MQGIENYLEFTVESRGEFKERWLPKKHDEHGENCEEYHFQPHF